jgi:hypothetical protein
MKSKNGNLGNAEPTMTTKVAWEAVKEARRIALG